MPKEKFSCDLESEIAGLAVADTLNEKVLAAEYSAPKEVLAAARFKLKEPIEAGAVTSQLPAENPLGVIVPKPWAELLVLPT
jgi:hypothetical protein